MKNEQVLEEWHQDTIDIVADEIESYEEFRRYTEPQRKATIVVVNESKLIKPFKFGSNEHKRVRKARI